MNIISIDVGIKNLAYCLFYVLPDKSYEINQWGVLNLCRPIPTCSNKTKKICKKSAKYFKNQKYYCKVHAKNKELKIPPDDFKNIDKLRINKLKHYFNLFKLTPTHKKMKKNQYLEILKPFFDKNFFNFVIIPKASELKMPQLGIEMKKQFDKIINCKIDRVIIENQISPIANRMKTLQGMIIQYFIHCGCTSIEEISAANKLKEFLPKDKNTTYNERKKLGIKVTTDIICTNPLFNKWDQFFLSHKKKDDLADSFLQGFWYLKKYIIN